MRTLISSPARWELGSPESPGITSHQTPALGKAVRLSRCYMATETTAGFIDCVSSWVPGAEAFFTSLVYNTVSVILHPFILQVSSKALRNEAGNVGWVSEAEFLGKLLIEEWEQ